MTQSQAQGAGFTADSALISARAMLRRHFDSVAFKDEPNGMKRGGWADSFADEIATLFRDLEAARAALSAASPSQREEG